jgi:uncharacterized membrane protein (UPF0127 family)
MKRLAAVVVAVLAAAAAWSALRRTSSEPTVNAAPSPAPQAVASPQPPGAAVIPMTFPSGTVLQAEIMVTDQQRALGLMFRPSLPLDRGLLFLFEQMGTHPIWMKNCKFPIDILWLDEQRRVVHLEEAVPPCKADPCPTYESLRQAAYVVEINARQARREKALVGSTLQFTLPR